MARRAKRWDGQQGFSFIELLVSVTVLALLASAVIPLATWDMKRRKEEHLRVALTTIREAIDAYNRYIVAGMIPIEDVEQCALPADLRTCYPLTLDSLVEGVKIGGDIETAEGKTIKFLQRIPEDPFTGTTEWGMRSYQDDFDATSWGGENVFDVYSLAPYQALDGTYYSEW
jgi:general secretion pathway protein G